MSDEIDDLRAFLAEEGNDLSQEQVRALGEFIDRIGGIENATLAIKLLDEAA
jgi:DNA-directed RNA polymerase subunit F